MIAGVHTLLYAHDAQAARAFFRDVLGLEFLDGGDGWLYFVLPPGELAFHPGPGIIAGREEGRAELFLMCRDVEATKRELEAKGVEFTEPVGDEGYGLLTRLKVPGFGELGLYEPRHPSPLPPFD
ncbi:MAG: extradiol dioxygenase [Solirubrobacterales bacterium]|nr:extradiol dioxygenase [Solirubrobacterales bacterium]